MANLLVVPSRKIAELLGGASILIDIIGPERLREWAKQHRGRTSRWAYWVDFALGGAIGSFVGFKTDTQISNYVRASCCFRG